MNIGIKLTLTVVALSFIVARLIWPNLNIDEITFGLLVLAMFPWIAPIIKSLKFPGVEITTRDMSAAGEKVTGAVKSASVEMAAEAGMTAEAEVIRGAKAADAAPDATEAVPEAVPTGRGYVYEVYLPEQDDPNLALVGFRIEVEKLLRELGNVVGIQPHQTLVKTLGNLETVLDPPVYSGLRDIIRAGNQAAHGATVEHGLADWVASNGREVLAAIDAILQSRRSQSPDRPKPA